MNRVAKRIAKVGKSPLLGVTVHSYNPIFVEMAGYLGFDAVWIEMEHMPNDYAKVCDLCRIASGAGMLTMIRIPDSRRDSVLKAAECDPDIIDLPMGNSPEVLNKLVRHARYAPEGERGFFGVSRAVKYGLAESISEQQCRINRELCLMSQVETMEAVERLDSLCAVPGIDAIFIGPGDLSVSMGEAGNVNSPSVLKTIEHIVAVAKRHEKIVAMAHGAAHIERWTDCGVDLLFCGSDVSCMGSGLRNIMQQAKPQITDISSIAEIDYTRVVSQSR